MRFERLDLERYGHFTGQGINFGALSKMGDLHLIYGPNEAGKSTLRDACIDFLFGFERITPYNFKHSNDTLLIGAEVSVNGEKINAQRIKSTNSSLRDRTGQPISDGMLKAGLGDVSRAHYLQMFSLDEDTLVEGGDEILKSKGDLGALLFSAASGLSSISSSLDTIQQQADGFYRPSGRTYRLSEHNKKLKVLKEKLKEIDLQAPAYERLRKEAELAKTDHAETKMAQDEKLAHARQLNALLQAAEIHDDYKDIVSKLVDLDDAPDVSDGVREKVEQLARQIAAGSSLLSESRQALERSTTASNNIQFDTIVLENAASIYRLSEDEIESRYRTSKDIEHRERDVSACEKEIQTILHKLGQANCTTPRALIIPSAVLGNVGDLLEQQTALQVDLKNASTELNSAKEHRIDLQKESENYANLPDLNDVAHQLNRYKSVMDIEVSKPIKRHLEIAQREMNDAIDVLAPWKGSSNCLQELEPPNQFTLRDLGSKLEQLNEQQKALLSEIARLETDSAGQRAMAQSLKSTSGLIEDQSADVIRITRSKVWAMHVAEFENTEQPSSDRLRKTSQAFEVAMQEDDTSSRLRLSQSTELAGLRQVEMELAKSEAHLQVAQKQKKELDTKLVSLTGEISELMIDVGLPPASDLKLLDKWLEKRLYAIGRNKAYLAAKSDFVAHDKRRAEAQQKLLNSIVAAGISVDQNSDEPQTLIEYCEAEITRWNDNTRLRDQFEKSLAEADTEQKTRQRQDDLMRQLGDEWQVNWTSALSNTWMENVKPAEAKHNLQLLGELDAIYIKLDDFQQRIADMKRNRAIYIAEVTRLAQAHKMNCDGINIDQRALPLADQLRSRLTQAKEDQRRQNEQQKLVADDTERLSRFQDEYDLINLQKEKFCDEFNVGDLDELLTQLKRGEDKAFMQSQADQLGKNIRKILNVETLEDGLSVLQDQCATVELVSTLRLEYASLKQEQSVEQEHLAQLYHQWKDAEQRLAAVGDDGDVARLEEERQVLLLQVEQEAQSYMRLVAGTLMVGEALRTYRDVHRSAMMQRASEAFAQITHRDFSGLTSAPGKNGDILVGIRSDGTSIEVGQMSRGTTFQLYLALRIAGHAEFAKSRETLPFFADDILEPFDDQRSAETFKLLAEMSQIGQVVYLTHHEHLIKIARDICGGAVHVHELPGAGRT